MTQILTFTSITTRDKEWDGIVAVHRGITVVTWSFNISKMGEPKLCRKRFKVNTSVAKRSECLHICVCLTHCGNSAVIGYSSGHKDKYNTQSGLHTVRFREPICTKDLYIFSQSIIDIRGPSIFIIFLFSITCTKFILFFRFHVQITVFIIQLAYRDIVSCKYSG